MQIDVSVKEWQHIQQMAAIGELTIGVVHDLRNQLACIGANMSLIEYSNANEALNKYVTSIKRQLSYANKMTESMLRVGAKGIDYENFDLALLMDDVARFFERVAGGITIKTFIDESVHLVSGCQFLISNSILNLCSNAKDAVGEQGIIEISLIRDYVEKVDNDILSLDFSGECSILTVRDTGCGIEPERIEEVFQPFFTTKNVASTHAGMGLANVIDTAREHGISMTVDSTVGVGTTFKLYFKAAA